eukprot:363790-Chlamydomonas_euryale.AAC.24
MAWLVGFEVVDVFVLIATAALAIAQASQVARNVTTNELANWHRYKYLHGPDGSFVNPFSHSCWENCTESFTPAQQKMAPVYLSHSNKLHAGSAGNVGLKHSSRAPGSAFESAQRVRLAVKCGLFIGCIARCCCIRFVRRARLVSRHAVCAVGRAPCARRVARHVCTAWHACLAVGPGGTRKQA